MNFRIYMYFQLNFIHFNKYNIIENEKKLAFKDRDLYSYQTVYILS